MSAHAPASTDERALLAGYLVQQQNAFRNAVFGLEGDDLGRTPTPSALCLGGLVKHATSVQRFWLDLALAAPGRPDEGSQPSYEDRDNEFRWLPDDSLDQVMEAFEAVSSAVAGAARELDLARPVPVPSAPWFPRDVEAWSVGWVWLHLIEELARHAGHADIIREAIDGATMHALMAGIEGWPETPYLTPWRPRQAVEAR